MSVGEKVLDIKIKNKNCYQVLQYLRIENGCFEHNAVWMGSMIIGDMQYLTWCLKYLNIEEMKICKFVNLSTLTPHIPKV